MACDVMSIGKILIGNFENKISDNKGRSYHLDFGLFFFLKKRLIEKIISKNIGLVKIKPANVRWMNWGEKHFNEVNSFHVNRE